ncbi:DUF4424 domain-containing protein [Rhizobium oryzicola]|uniref:DUF4424 domain-containing protein n=1 Tax=Rhizobium oryzicola TaxID=1232668 RepID=A0ABT8SS59_9HYPH|nr:DUF4424 domain-containing protein [Rhizobium oryzicola]MDO1581252.1 DUF4424 domain-containing protein [Rhizobium oryzicola]
MSRKILKTISRALHTISALLALAAAASANDSVAEFKTGTLVFLYTDKVEMSEEDLFISMDEVRVDYVFTNKTDKDVETVVAFPMPDLQGSHGVLLNDPEADNFVGFTVTQDGNAISPNLEQHVLAGGIDHTDELRQAKVPLLPYSDKTPTAIAALPDATRKDWVSKGLVWEEPDYSGKETRRQYIPLWTLRSTYWWKTTFPAGKTVRVSHRYKPGVGGNSGIWFVEDGKTTDAFKDYSTRYCMDDAFLKTATKLSHGTSGKDPFYTEKRLSYILTTGAHWGGTIGKFKLTIDKGKPENYLSFCGDGVKKTGPTTFVMEKTDFYPAKDLDILILFDEGVAQ